MSADAPRRLGRGLEALISTAKAQREMSPIAGGTASRPTTDLQTVRIAEVSPNRFQPRRIFTESELGELEASIHANGLLQPITVRPPHAIGSPRILPERGGSGDRRSVDLRRLRLCDEFRGNHSSKWW